MMKLRRVGILALLAAAGLAGTGCSGNLPVGAVISETGAAAVYGERVKNGLDLALDEINEAGGVRGRTVELIYKDDATIPDVGRKVVDELIEQDGVGTIIGPITSPVMLAIAPVCEKKRVVLLSPTASTPQITDSGEYIFRSYPSDVLEGTSIAKFARERGLERVVVFTVRNEFGKGLEDVFRQQFASKYRQILKVYEFVESDTSSFDPMVKEVEALDPDGIYIIGYVSDVAELLKKIRAAQVPAVIMGSSSVTEDIVRLAGGAAENLVFPQTSFDAESTEPAVRDFVEAYRARFNEEPDTFAAHGYDALKILVLAMNNANSTHPDSIKFALLGIDNYMGASGRTAFDDNGDVVQYPRLFIIRQGQPIAYDKFEEQGGALSIPGQG